MKPLDSPKLSSDLVIMVMGCEIGVVGVSVEEILNEVPFLMLQSYRSVGGLERWFDSMLRARLP